MHPVHHNGRYAHTACMRKDASMGQLSGEWLVSHIYTHNEIVSITILEPYQAIGASISKLVQCTSLHHNEKYAHIGRMREGALMAQLSGEWLTKSFQLKFSNPLSQ